MRIVINDYLGQAQQIQLSRSLAARGHHVLHLYSSDVQTLKADLQKHPSDPSHFFVEGLKTGRRISGSFLRDRLQESAFGRAASNRILQFEPDICMSCNTPLVAQRRIQSVLRSLDIPFVFWLQQFGAVEMDRVIADRPALIQSIIGAYFHSLERSLLQRSDAIIPTSNEFLGILAEIWDIDERHCMVVQNWAPLDVVRPTKKNNPWAQGRGLTDKKVILYAGNLGPMENPMLLVDLAESLQQHSDVVIVVVSEGPGAELLGCEAKSRNLENVMVLPFQPYEHYSDVLASADILIGMIKEQTSALSASSKIASYLCAARPIVFSSPWYNVAATALRESGGGRVVPPGSVLELKDAVVEFLDDEELRLITGACGRCYAEQAFEISTITDKFERLFARLLSGVPRRARSS